MTEQNSTCSVNYMLRGFKTFFLLLLLSGLQIPNLVHAMEEVCQKDHHSTHLEEPNTDEEKASTQHCAVSHICCYGFSPFFKAEFSLYSPSVEASDFLSYTFFHPSVVLKGPFQPPEA